MLILLSPFAKRVILQLMKPLIRAFGAVAGLLRAEYRQIYNRYFGTVERFEGDARTVGQQILARLWAGDFYRTSLGHYNFFWMRDFGTVADSLTHLNETTHVHYTLRWALRHYMRAGTITLCIDKSGHTFNAPGKPGIDTLPWLLHSIYTSRYAMTAEEHEFLQTEVDKYVERFLDETGDIKKDVKFAEMRDAVFYDRSAYAVALVGRLALCAEKLRFEFPFTLTRYQEILRKEYWTGDFLRADRASQTFSSDSALVPFYLEVLTDRDMVNATLDYISKIELNKPYPLKYGEVPKKPLKYRFGMGPLNMPNYTETSIWTWHATFYLHLLHRYERPEYTEQYRKFCELIELHGSYPELLNPDASWYNAPFYKSDPGMVWVALFLELPEPKRVL